MLIMDVDGTLTDGKIYYGSDGIEMKAFDIKDGYAIKHYLPSNNIIPVIITGRTSDIVSRRAAELGIEEVHQGVLNKVNILQKMKKKYNLQQDNVAYIGDDVIDIECMRECGLIACPADAVKEVVGIANYVCKNKGGQGAVREFIDYLISERTRE